VPARREYTAVELAERLERQREQARLRMALLRARNRSRNAAAVRVTEAVSGRAGDAHPPIPPSSLSISKEIERVGRLLAPLAARGYEHQPDLWAELAATYPAARLSVEAYKIASWFKDAAQRSRKVKSWPAFLDNWLKKAQRDATAPPTAHPMAYQTPSPGKPPDPAPLLPDGESIQMVDRAHAQRALFDAKKLNLAEKLALARNGTNGRH
jgi:hypothetical protein